MIGKNILLANTLPLKVSLSLVGYYLRLNVLRSTCSTVRKKGTTSNFMFDASSSWIIAKN